MRRYRVNNLSRSADPFDRLAGYALSVNDAPKGGVGYAYDPGGCISHIIATNPAGRVFTVAYTNVAGYNYGYTITTLNGGTIRRVVERDAFRRSLVTNCATYFNSSPIEFHTYAFDALSRPTVRIASRTGCQPVQSSFAYNNRSEVVSAAIGANLFTHSYDDIGNHLLFGDNSVTNTFTHNALNQMVGRAAPSAPQTSLAYDADGNMTRYGTYSYSYDAENRLRSVTSRTLTNGALRVLNAYDHRNRRNRKTVQRLHVSVAQPPALPVEIREWQTLETHTFVWDGNKIVFEKVVFADDTVRTFEYFWGVDKSGTEQGAGGVGGLLAVSVDGEFFIPCYDHNGNIILYFSETGTIAAQYTYDPYGNIIESSGLLVDVFTFGFSTQYHDRETGMVGYKRRFYRPDLGRWLNRDPIEEEGGENLYGFCGNNPVLNIDNKGTEVYTSITLKRNHLQAISAILYEIDKDFPEGDYWGHWWIELGDESYGWWPSNKVDNIKAAMKGVRGDLNGQKSFGGTATKDPHHGDKAEESFNPRRNENGTMQYGGAKGKKCQCTTEEDAKDCIRAFAKNYSGEWRWPGRSCHTFQEEAMSNCCLVR